MQAVVVRPGQVDDSLSGGGDLMGRRLIGHGLLTADLEPLQRATRQAVSDLTDQCHDLLVLSRLEDPSPGGTRPQAVRAHHSIDALAARHGLPWNADPTTQDATLRALAAKYPMTDYGRREHQAMGIVGQIRLNGFRVDEDRLDVLLAGESDRRARLIERLVSEGLPLRGKDGGPARDPLDTEPGREFLAGRFHDLGVDLGHKPSGEVDLSKEALTDIAQGLPPDHPGFRRPRSR